MAAAKKYLYKSSKNRKLSGVLGGVGEHYSVDPTLLRLIWILIVVFTGFMPGLISYILAAIVMPSEK